MSTKFIIAKNIQVLLIAVLPMTIFGWLLSDGGFLSLVLIGLPSMLLAAYVSIGLRCERCGVSYFFAADGSNWGMQDGNIFRSVPKICEKCGFDREN